MQNQFRASVLHRCMLHTDTGKVHYGTVRTLRTVSCVMERVKLSDTRLSLQCLRKRPIS